MSYGIQSRGGCSCAGPYGHALLDIDQERSDAFIAEMKEHGDAIKPGWARVTFGYYFSPATVDYMIDAVHWVARHGEKLLPWYKMDLQTTMWIHVSAPPTTARPLWKLEDTAPPAWRTQGFPKAKQYRQLLRDADRLVANLRSSSSPPKTGEISLPESTNKLRWFVLAEETVASGDAPFPQTSGMAVAEQDLFQEESGCEGPFRHDGRNTERGHFQLGNSRKPVPLEMPVPL